jgi:hypothetical protein
MELTANSLKRNLCDNNLAIRYQAALSLSKLALNQPLAKSFLTKFLPFIMEDLLALYEDTSSAHILNIC